MEADNIDVRFQPVKGDRTDLSKSSLATLQALYRHPISHNLEWADVVGLFTKLGSVEQKPHNAMAFKIGDEHLQVRRSHSKDLTADEVMDFRHLLTRAGWAPTTETPMTETRGATSSDRLTPAPATADDLLVVIEHHEARLYRLAVNSKNPLDDVILPYDPHHFLHHLSHKDQPREHGQRASEDSSFYERIAKAVVAAGRIVVVGHGKGHSDAAHHLIAYLKLHHTEIFEKLRSEIVADLSSLTPPQLLVLGRRALSS